MPTPTIKEMLLTGHWNGLKTVHDAWLDYNRHNDLFFDLDHYQEQHDQLWHAMRLKGIVDLDITEALDRLNITIPVIGSDKDCD